MDRDSLHVAVTVAEDLRLGAGCLHKRIVRGHAAVVMQANQFAVVVAQVLRGMRFELALGRHLAIAKRQVQKALVVEGDLATEVAKALRFRLEQLLDVGEPIVLEAATDQRRRRRHDVLRRGRLAHLLRIGEIQQLVGREVGVHRDLEQTALAAVHDRRQAFNGVR